MVAKHDRIYGAGVGHFGTQYVRATVLAYRQNGVSEAVVSVTPASKTRTGWSRTGDDKVSVVYRGPDSLASAYRKAKDSLRDSGFEGCIERYNPEAATPNPASTPAARKGLERAMTEGAPLRHAGQFAAWANHEAYEAKLLMNTAKCCTGKSKRETAQGEAMGHVMEVMVGAAESGFPLDLHTFRMLDDVRKELGKRFPQLGLRILKGSKVQVEYLEDNPRRSGRGSYPWEQCMADAFKRYGDKDTARRVCGSIRAKSMARNNPALPFTQGDVDWGVYTFPEATRWNFQVHDYKDDTLVAAGGTKGYQTEGAARKAAIAAARKAAPKTKRAMTRRLAKLTRPNPGGSRPRLKRWDQRTKRWAADPKLDTRMRKDYEELMEDIGSIDPADRADYQA